MPYETQNIEETSVDALEAEPFEFETEGGTATAQESPFSEAEEMEYAAQLLEITDDHELDQFLGDLFRKAGAVVGRVMKTPIGQQLGGLVKGAIKKALPRVGAAIGGYFVPGAGAAVGSQLAAKAGQWLGLELEGLSAEDQEYEIAKQLVRLAGTAARHAVATPLTDASAVYAARRALAKAARRYGPGLVRSLAQALPGAAGLFEGETTEEFEAPADYETESPFNETEEVELATQLLEVTDEAELDQFLGSLLRKASRAVGSVIKSPLGQQLGGLLKGAIKKALPGVGAAIGGAIPGVGGALGGQLATQAGHLLGLELEGLSPEDQEFEAAKQLVRFAGAAVQDAASAPPSAAGPAAVARNAVAQAARQHAPGLVRRVVAAADPARSGACHCRRRSAGRWVRHAGKIILLGA